MENLSSCLFGIDMSNPSLEERSASNGHVSISGAVNRDSVAAYSNCTTSPLILEVLIWLRSAPFPINSLKQS